MNKTTQIIIAVIVVIIILVGIWYGVSKKSAVGEIKIGAILPVTGWGSYWGEPAKKGMLFAAEKINDPNLKLLIEDTQSDNKNAVTAAQKLLDVDKVDVVLVEFTGASNAVSPIVLEKNKVMIYDSFSQEVLNNNPNAFKFYFDPYKEYKRLGEIALSKGTKNIAAVLAQLDFTSKVKQALEDIKGLNITYYEYDFHNTDFRTILTKVKSQKADAIVGLGYEDNFINLVKQMTEFGINLPIYCGGRFDCLTEKVLSSGNIPEAYTFDIELQPWFKEEILKKYPSMSGVEIMAAATGYDMVLYAYNAVKNCPTRNPDCIKSQLLTLKINNSAMKSSGFRSDRQYDISTILLKYDKENKQFVPVK